MELNEDSKPATCRTGVETNLDSTDEKSSYEDGSRSTVSEGHSNYGRPCLDLQELDNVFSSAKKSNTGVELGLQLEYQRTVINHFTTSMIRALPDKTDDIRTDLLKLKATEPENSGDEWSDIANSKFVDEGDLMEAILLYQKAAAAFEKENSLAGIKNCCSEINTIAVHLFRDTSDKSLIKSKILPIFYELRLKIQGMSNARDGERVICEANCIHKTTDMLFLLSYEDFKNVETLCKEGLQMMEAKFSKKSCAKYSVYGMLLCRLGTAISQLYAGRFRQGEHEHGNRLPEAEQYYSRALSVYEKAQDFDSDKEKGRLMYYAKDKLQTVKATQS